MVVTLYYAGASSPCRAVCLVANAIGVKLNLKFTNLMKGENRTPEFLKMNPQHTIPTMDDNGFYLWESRAICTYLIERYAKNDALYPKDPQKRALVNQRLYFDFGTLYQPFVDNYIMVLFTRTQPDPLKLTKIAEAFAYLDHFLEGEEYVAGDHLTVADINLMTTVSNYTIVDYDFSKYENVTRWFEKVKGEVPKYEEINGNGLNEYKAFITYMKNKL